MGSACNEVLHEDPMGNVDSLKDETKGNREDLVNHEEEMRSKMEEGFKNEQDSKSKARWCRVSRTKKMRDIWFVKDEIKNLRMGCVQ